MPEGPEVRRVADQPSRALREKTVLEVFFAFPRLEEWGAHLQGDAVERVDAYGKALVLVFHCGYAVYTHNKLYGKWLIRRAGIVPKTKRQLRFAVETDDKSAFLYSASDIEILHQDELEEHPYIRKLGPDPLRFGYDREQLHDILRQKGRRTLGGLLLDQSFIAGVGNYLRSEILFDARLHFDRKLSDLDDQERNALATSVERIMVRGYRQRGRTVLREEGLSSRHYVFTRAGQPCFACGGAIERVEVAARRL